MKREDVSKIIPGITSDQLDSIMNLHGADITAKVNEITTLKAEKTTLTEQLSTANSKLEGYDPEWKAKAEQAKTDAAAQVAALEKGYALERKASGLKFSSESARKAFLTDAKAQNFAMKDGEIMSRLSKRVIPAPFCRTAVWHVFPHRRPAHPASPQTHMRPQTLHSAQRSARKVDSYGY